MMLIDDFARYSRVLHRLTVDFVRAVPDDKWDFMPEDRKSTRLNQSHSDLVCRLLLEKKKKQGDGWDRDEQPTDRPERAKAHPAPREARLARSPRALSRPTQRLPARARE